MPENGATTESTEPTEAQTQSATPADVAEQLGEGGEKALKAERAARTAAEKREKALQARLDEIERSQMTDAERAKADAEALRKELEDAPKKVAQDLRGTLASLFEIDETNAALYLTSDDPKTLLQQALGLTTRSTPATPKPDRTQGGSGQPVALNSDGLEQALRDKLGI